MRVKNLAQRWEVYNFAACLATLACSGAPAEIADVKGSVKGESVMRHVEKMVSYGPHPPGSEAQKQVGAYIIRQLESFGLEVRSQTFEPFTPRGRLEMTNIWGVAKGESSRILLLASHYDSKYFEDFPFVGANDSGSSSALVLELARILAQDNPTRFTLWFVFFDGEEAIREWTSADSLYGSRQFVKMLKIREELQKISGLILLDMVGDKDLLLRRETYSTGWLKDLIWTTARTLGYGNTFTRWGSTGTQDDHIPFAEESVPVVDIIDLDYAHWHRPEDTPDKLSPRNLEIVGEVVLASLPEIERYVFK